MYNFLNYKYKHGTASNSKGQLNCLQKPYSKPVSEKEKDSIKG